jgi:hypothetical protein
MERSILRRLPLFVKKLFVGWFPPPKTNNDSADQIWLISAPGVQAAPDEDGLVLLDLDTGRIYTCHPIASWIWLSATDGFSLDATADLIATRFGLTKATALRDIQSFVSALQQRGLANQRGRL